MSGTFEGIPPESDFLSGISFTLEDTPSEESIKRRHAEIRNLVKKNYRVELIDDNLEEINVIFHGPDNTPYEGGVWRVNVFFSVDHPMSPPIISFENKIFHPNIRKSFGTVCIDVLKENWSPNFELSNVFDIFLPYLLAYPDSDNPFNSEAAVLHGVPDLFEKTVKEYIEQYAKPEDIVPDEEKLADLKISVDEKDSDEVQVEGGAAAAP